MAEMIGGFGTILLFIGIVYLVIVGILLPHYVRQIRNDVRRMADATAGTTTGSMASMPVENPGNVQEILAMEGVDRYKKMRMLADLRDKKVITREEFEEYKGRL